MSSRRHHTKSRHGCTNCKRRKVKCDETHPSCHNCYRHGVPCSFVTDRAHRRTRSPPELTLPVDPRLKAPFPGPGYFTPESIHEPHPIPSPMPTSLPTSSDDLWALSGLELMHHYTTATANSLGFRSDMRHVWRCIYPQIGYDHPFVMHGLLSLAALHKSEMFRGSPEQRERYIDLATYHQGLGMEPFRAGLANLNDQNWKPLMCFSSCIVIYVCFRPSHTVMGLTAGSSDAANILSVFSLVRGHRVVLEPYQSLMHKSGLAPLVHGIWRLEPEGDIILEEPAAGSKVPDDVFQALQELSVFFQKHVQLELREDYALAVELLEKVAHFMNRAGPDPECGMLMMFAYVVPEAVVAEMQSFSPNALALLAYFSVFWSIMEPKYWFLKGWTQGLFEIIDSKLAGDEEIMGIINWPRRQVERLADSQG